MQRKITIITFCILFSISLFKFTQYNNLLKYTSVFNQNESEYEIFIDLEEHLLYLFQNDALIKTYPIACGKPITPSPIGVWKIVYKGMWGEGFGGRFFKLNVPWGTFGIHGTGFPKSIGSKASHGCIRMYNSNVAEMYNIVPVGTTVIITNGIYGPFYSNQRIIYPGNSGTDVLAVQLQLKKFGYYNGALDGIYGINLEKALNNYQKDNALEIKNSINNWDLKALGFGWYE